MRGPAHQYGHDRAAPPLAQQLEDTGDAVYTPGAPREPFEYVQNYLAAVLGGGLGLDVDFIVPELTMAPHNPAMAELVPLFEASRDRALDEAARKAERLAERSAA